MGELDKGEWPDYEHELRVGVEDMMTRWRASIAGECCRTVLWHIVG